MEDVAQLGWRQSESLIGTQVDDCANDLASGAALAPRLDREISKSSHHRGANAAPLASANHRLSRLRSAAGVFFGVATQAVFLLTVWYLFAFLKGPIPARSGSLWWDVLLTAQFALPHSWLLLPSTRKRLSRWIAAPFYGLVFCLATCASLFVTFSFWTTSEFTLWDVAPQGRWLIDVGYYGSWVALFYSLHLSGLGYQTGLTPWWHWVRGEPQPRRGFELRGAYRVMRHPIYASFLGLIWFTPTMTLDHAILTVLWTAYILVGSHFKDERLAHFLGDSYRQYQARIPGFGLRIISSRFLMPLYHVTRSVSEGGCSK